MFPEKNILYFINRKESFRTYYDAYFVQRKKVMKLATESIYEYMLLKESNNACSENIEKLSGIEMPECFYKAPFKYQTMAINNTENSEWMEKLI